MTARTLTWVAVACASVLSTAAAAQHASVSGTVAYRERIALPPTAALEVTLEDISRADAPSNVIARIRVPTPGQPPIPFDLPYEIGRIDARNRYAVRARIYDGERLLFTSTENVLVLTQGRGAVVSLTLQMAGGARGGAAPGRGIPAPSSPAPAVEPTPQVLPPPVTLTGLPATFTGTLPCADCPGIRYELNLFPDDSYFLRTTYQNRPAVATDDLGSWVLSSDRRVIVLRGATGKTEMFAIRDNTRLRKLDVNGQEIRSTLPYDLRRTSSFTPLALRGRLTGSYSYMADAARFVECSTGQSWPVAEEGANTALQRAYVEARAKPGAPVLATVEGHMATRRRIDRAGTEPVLVVDRVEALRASDTCQKRFAALPLEDTTWKLTMLGTKPYVEGPNQRSTPSLTFRSDSKAFSGSGGCNRLAGNYQIGAESLTMRAVGTLMACPGAGDTEQTFTRALNDTRRYRILGTVLELYDARGTLLLRFSGQ